MDASSASEDDLDSEDSEQEIKSCSHCGATSEYMSFICVLSHWAELSILMFYRFLQKPFNVRTFA